MCCKYAFPKKEGGDDDGTCAVEGCIIINFMVGCVVQLISQIHALLRVRREDSKP